MDKSRKISFDILRILAAFSVVMLHVSSRYIMGNPVDRADFYFANFYDSINGFGVPIFVMISGAIFLDKEKEIDVKSLWIHNILRILIVFILWNYAYYVYQSIHEWHFDFIHASVERTIKGIVYGSDHLWFLAMLIGLYVLVPVLRTWLVKATKQNIEYFLMMFLIFNVLKTSAVLITESSMVFKLSQTFSFVEFSGFLGYFVLGYYLTNYEPPKRLRQAIYASVPFAAALNYLISMKLSLRDDSYNPGVYDCFGIFTFIEVTALFMAVTILVKRRKKDFRPATQKFLKNLSNDTFGVYLIHLGIIDYLFTEGYFAYFTPAAALQIPLAIAIFISASLVSALLRRIPVIGRYIC